MTMTSNKTQLVIHFALLLAVTVSCTIQSRDQPSQGEYLSRNRAIIGELSQIGSMLTEDRRGEMALDGTVPDNPLLYVAQVTTARAMDFVGQFSVSDYEEVLVTQNVALGAYLSSQYESELRINGEMIAHPESFAAGCYIINRLIFQIDSSTPWPYADSQFSGHRGISLLRSAFFDGTQSLLHPWTEDANGLRLVDVEIPMLRREERVYDPLSEYRLFAILFPPREQTTIKK